MKSAVEKLAEIHKALGRDSKPRIDADEPNPDYDQILDLVLDALRDHEARIDDLRERFVP